MTDRYAVVGNPIGHSLSPRIHAAFAQATGERLRYDRIEAPREGFAAAAEAFFAAGGKGLNVTVPFKLDAYRWTDEHDGAAQEAGAVNTIYMADGARRGCNTDGAGLVRDLTRNLGWPMDGARTLIVGAGGAVQGIVAPLKGAGASDITIANRTHARAERLAERFGVRACRLEEVGGGWDLVVNGTSAGLIGTGDLVAPHALAGSRCYDLVYDLAAPTPFCRAACRHGAQAASDGLGMLVEQAAEAFRLWRGVLPGTADMVAMLRAGGSP